MQDGVHVAPLVGAVEDNLVGGGAQLGTLGLVAQLHVLTADVLKTGESGQGPFTSPLSINGLVHLVGRWGPFSPITV